MTIELTLKQIDKINPYWYENLNENEEIMWNTLWNFDHIEYSIKNAKIVRECGMIPIEVEGLLFCGLAGCGMDLTPLIIYTKYRLLKLLDTEDIHYLKNKDQSYLNYVIGNQRFIRLKKYIDLI